MMLTKEAFEKYPEVMKALNGMTLDDILLAFTYVLHAIYTDADFPEKESFETYRSYILTVLDTVLAEDIQKDIALQHRNLSINLH